MTATCEEIRCWIVRDHQATVAATIAVADGVTAELDGPADRLTASPRRPMERAIERRGLPDRYAEALRTLRDRLGYGDAPGIVPAPPYVTTSSCGPVLRMPGATGRLVVNLAVFEVVPGEPVTYRRRGDRPADVVVVRRRDADRP